MKEKIDFERSKTQIIFGDNYFCENDVVVKCLENYLDILETTDNLGISLRSSKKMKLIFDYLFYRFEKTQKQQLEKTILEIKGEI